MELGEAFIGDGPNAAHVNTVLGPRDGPAGYAWANALASPSAGHAPFVAVLQPGLPAKPFTLFVNKAAIADDHHGQMTWGPAQAGVAAGVADAVADEVLTLEEADELVLIAAVWVNPEADDPDEVFANNREATTAAIANGRAGVPYAVEVVEQRDHAWNPYYE